MNQGRTAVLTAASLAVGLLATGCSANLTTRVEVYHPKSRLIELDDKQTPLKNLIEKRLEEERWRAAQEGPLAQIREMKDQIACLAAVPVRLGQAVVEWNQSENAGDPVMATAAKSVAATIQSRSGQAIRDFEDDLRQTESAFANGQLTVTQLALEISDIKQTFESNFKHALRVVDEGDPTVLPDKVKEASTEPEVTLPKCAASIFGTHKSSLARLSTKNIDARLGRDRAGVLRPDTIEETYTDPLLNAAIKDLDGWKALPAATVTSADGKSDTVIIRDGQFSFSVHTLENDPSVVLQHRLSLANSTINLLSQISGTLGGVSIPLGTSPTPAPPAPSEGEEEEEEETADDSEDEASDSEDDQSEESEDSGATDSTDSGTTAPTTTALPIKALVQIAKLRLREAERLLAENPSGAAEQKRWIEAVNALLQPITPTPAPAEN